MKLLYKSHFTIKEFIKANKNIKFEILEEVDFKDKNKIPLKDVFLFIEKQLIKKPLHRLFFIKQIDNKIIIEDSLTKDKNILNLKNLKEEVVIFSKIFQDFKISKKLLNKNSFIIYQNNQIKFYLYKSKKYYIFPN